MRKRLIAATILLVFAGLAQGLEPDLGYFKALTKSVTRDQVHKDVGEPKRVMGSGLVIDIYGLTDGSEVSIIWSGPHGNLVYAAHGKTTLVK